MVVTAICMSTAARAQAVDSPDELYRKGRFAEAEKAYAQSDMDNPKDLRYRYNRGCAAYQSGDYQAAAAAFASVLRRSQDDEMRSKAAYNLGNAAYKQGDFQSAAKYYKQAIAHDPSSEDARHNLELAIIRVQQMQKKPSEQSGDQSQPGADQQQDPSDGKNNQEDQGQQSDDKSSEQDSAQKQQKQNESEQSKGSQEQSAEQSPEKKSGESRQSGQKSQQELAGELKPREDMPPAQAGEQTPKASMVRMNQKKAEALLDNIQEDRAQMMRIQTQGRRQGVGSGKDW